ncbi:hypothetical protein Tsubulata_024296 [Turnera subulata]|uniref:Mini-chromosome maintenance complex-binding protein n=2 Tax=Turnera subulata TaxID=218843 RepID=A0A9Q0GGR9_9ROSI|nr:hypothetical protein Tsubulata_024296 [Turnera subulata]
MVGPQYDLLANPLGAVRLTFERAMAAGIAAGPYSASDGKDWGAVPLFQDFLFDHSRLSQVPILNHETVKWIGANTLVRYRGMVQDMLGNEFYVGAHKVGSVWKTNKFSDHSQFPMDSSCESRVWERRLLYCVPVPGLNSWAEPTWDGLQAHRPVDFTSPQRDKRPRMDIEEEASGDGSSEHSPSLKKMREDGHPSTSSQCQDSMTVESCHQPTMLADTERDSLPCLVKIYDSPESDLQLNNVFEFIGVLTFDSDIPADKNARDDFSSSLCDEELVRLPPSKVPRLHCIIHRKLELPDFLCRSPVIEPNHHFVKHIREALLKHLTTIFGNDGVVAHFVLLHLLSKVHARLDNMAVGKFSLNLTGLSKESVSVFGSQLSIALKNLLPLTNFIPLTVGYLNRASLAPKKDYQLNRLIPGVLQLAEGSHLIIDETQLEAGTLNSVGVENASLLKDLMEFQKVKYDFQYYSMEMAADIKLLILSEGKSNILPADIIVPFQPSSVSSLEVVDAESLDAWRWYLANVRSLEHTIQPEMQKVVENDLVAARQTDRTLGSQEFSRWLTMARLISASFGETSLSLEHWQMAKELERLRKERLG